MGIGWLQWPAVALYLFLTFKAYGYLRDHHGTSNGSWLEGIGALYIAPIVAPFMLLIGLNHWLAARREATQIRNGRGPLTTKQKVDQRNTVVGTLVLVSMVALISYLLFGSFH